MIQFVWIIIRDTPISGMRFIKISDKEERERLEKFYGWISGPISEFTGKIHDLIIENTKYYYHSNNDVLFIVGADINETGIPSVFFPELEGRFFSSFSAEVITTFDGTNIMQFRSFDKQLVELVKAFSNRKIEGEGKRKSLDAFEVLNLPSELQMVALVLVKLQVVTPEMISEVSGIPPEEVARHLRRIYQEGYLYITTIGDKTYFSVRSFDSDAAPKAFTKPPPSAEARKTAPPDAQDASKSPPPKSAQSKDVPSPPKEPRQKFPPSSITSPSSIDPSRVAPIDSEKEKIPDMEIGLTEAEKAKPSRFEDIQSAMMPPPKKKRKKRTTPSKRADVSPPARATTEPRPSRTSPRPSTIRPKLEEAKEPQMEEIPSALPDVSLPLKEAPSEESIARDEPSTKAPHVARKEPKGIKLKEDPIAKEIDESLQMAIVIPKNGLLPSDSFRRENTFLKKVNLPSEKNKHPFLLNQLIKRELENLFEAMLMGDMIVIVGEEQEVTNTNGIEEIFETMNLLTPHRKLLCVKSDKFVHPKDADVVYVPRSLLKYYSWATILDLDKKKVIGGKDSEFSRDLVKRIRKEPNPKKVLATITNETAALIKICRGINTLKIEGRGSEPYLDEVKKTYGMDLLEAGLSLSEKLVRPHKDCAYIAGFYIRKGLDIVVRALVVGEPVVVIGDDPLDVFHVIAGLAIFSPHKTVATQIWTTNFAGIEMKEFDMMGAQEGTDKLFKGSVQVNLGTMSAHGGPRSEFVHNFLRQMWKRRSKERPKFIREKINEWLSYSKEIIEAVDSWGEKKASKEEVKNLFKEFDSDASELIVDLIRKERPDIANKIKHAL